MKKKIKINIIITLLLLLLTCVTACDDISSHVASSRQTETASIEYQKATVIRVIDGDTITVSLDDSIEHKVRLIGIDAPESVNPNKNKNTQAGNEASEFLKRLLPEKSIVWLEKDVSDTDKYDRLLRYVYTSEPIGEPDIEWLNECMLNAIIIENGHATAKEYKPDTKYAWLFSELEL